MRNYRFKAAEIDKMKQNILTHCRCENVADKHGNTSAWRLRLVLESMVLCVCSSKRDTAQWERKLYLYESLTKNDLPNWEA